MLETIKKEWQARFVLFFFVILTIFWFLLQIGLFNGQILFNHSYFKFFGAIYGFVALCGAISGITITGKWGGTKSVMGKAIILFSLGLLAQEFGQIVLSYIDYIYNIQGSYPSLGDVGYFGSIPLYIAGVLYLAKASGINISLKSYESKLQAIFIPLSMLIVSYFIFLRGYTFDWSNPIKIFLDFGYPFGQAIYISLALVTYLLSRGVLGGIMKSKILFILFALCIQFLSDYTFLYQSSNGTWKVGEINDYMYLVAYFLMTIGLIQLNTVYRKLKS